jgi:hypothetical protein
VEFSGRWSRADSFRLMQSTGSPLRTRARMPSQSQRSFSSPSSRALSTRSTIVKRCNRLRSLRSRSVHSSSTPDRQRRCHRMGLSPRSLCPSLFLVIALSSATCSNQHCHSRKPLANHQFLSQLRMDRVGLFLPRGRSLSRCDRCRRLIAHPTQTSPSILMNRRRRRRRQLCGHERSRFVLRRASGSCA